MLQSLKLFIYYYLFVVFPSPPFRQLLWDLLDVDPKRQKSHQVTYLHRPGHSPSFAQSLWSKQNFNLASLTFFFKPHFQNGCRLRILSLFRIRCTLDAEIPNFQAAYSDEYSLVARVWRMSAITFSLISGVVAVTGRPDLFASSTYASLMIKERAGSKPRFRGSMRYLP